MEIGKQIENLKVINHFTDFRGELFLRVLCNIFNDISELQTKKFGVDIPSLNKENQTWMLHRLHLLIHRLPTKGEIIQIETWPSGIDRLFALRDYRVLDENKQLLVEGISEWMLIDLNRRRPMRLTEKVFQMRNSAHCTPIVLPKLITRDEEIVTRQKRHFIATYDNIDFNGHVTQAAYIAWITNALPFYFLSQHRLKEIEVIYEHEIMPDAEINSSYVVIHEDDQSVEMLHRIDSSIESITHCIAKTIWEKRQ